jgi:hypothetical protein
MTDRAIPANDLVANETGHSHFLAFDFGVCENSKGELEPQLIEMQGFPTLYGFEAFYPEILFKHFDIPSNYSHFFNGHTKESYIKVLKELIVGDTPVENVILLEINPLEQKTRIDFFCTEDYIGVKPVSITDVFAEGRDLFYMNDGKKTKIEKIYNRIIFDDLHANREKLGDIIDIRKDWNVKWITHPNWFYRISKYTLPFIKHPYVPETFFSERSETNPGKPGGLCIETTFFFRRSGCCDRCDEGRY